jgi:hypothetical protein
MFSAGCLQLFAVSQSFPGPRSVKLGPAAVVRIVTLMRTPREVGHAVRRDQQVAGNRGSMRASFRQSVLAEFSVHVTQFAEGHVVYDDVFSGTLDPDQSLQRRSLDTAAKIRSCRDDGHLSWRYHARPGDRGHSGCIQPAAMTAAPASMSAGLCRRGSCRHHGVADQAQRLSRRQHVHTDVPSLRRGGERQDRPARGRPVSPPRPLQRPRPATAWNRTT